MKINTLIVLFCLYAAFAGCEKETEPDASIGFFKNYPPGSFLVRVLTTSYNYAVIEWESAIDPNMDTLIYTVYFNDSIIAIMQTDSILRIENLKPETEYQGKIEVTDKKSDAVVVPFFFKTKKYFLSFNKLYPEFRWGSSIELTHDGGYVIGSSTYDSDNDIDRALIIKLDSLGYVQWTTNKYSFGTKVKPTTDNGYILFGNGKITKLNHLGKEVSCYPSDQATIIGSYVIETTDNNFLIAGTWSGSLHSTPTISKYNLNTGLIWEKYYERFQNAQARFIEKSSDGNYVLLGIESSGEDQNLFVIKIDGDGNLLWEKSYKNYGYNEGYQIRHTNDNGSIICAGNMGNYNIYSTRILKIDHEGNTQWDKSFLWNNYRTAGYSIAQTPDGGYLFSGGNGYSPIRGLLVKLDAEGVLVWKKEFKPDYMDYVWVLSDLKLTKDGGVIMTGGKKSVWGYGTKELGMWLMKSDLSGNIE